METVAIVRFEGTDALVPAQLVEAARTFAQESRAQRTRAAYRLAFGQFNAWCEERRLVALPAAPGTVALYLADRASAGRRVATVELDAAGIAAAHRAAGHASPRDHVAVKTILAGIRRSVGVAPRQKRPALASDVRTMAGALPEGLQGLRDRALLLLGFSGAFRRSELVSLDVEDLAFGEDGLTVTLKRSKTDQEGEGRSVGIPFGSSPASCPVRTVRAWIDAAGIREGSLFRAVTGDTVAPERLSDKAVARLVKRAAEAGGLDPAGFSGHSLRAGLCTSAAKAGKSERAIMKTTGHKTSRMVARYIRDAELFSDNAAAGLL